MGRGFLERTAERGRGGAGGYDGAPFGLAQDDWIANAVLEVASARARANVTTMGPGEAKRYLEGAEEALYALGDAVRALQALNSLLYESRQGTTPMQRYRSRSLNKGITQLAEVYFTDAKTADGSPLDWRTVLPEIPRTWHGRLGFGGHGSRSFSGGGAPRIAG